MGVWQYSNSKIYIFLPTHNGSTALILSACANKTSDSAVAWMASAAVSLPFATATLPTYSADIPIVRNKTHIYHSTVRSTQENSVSKDSWNWITELYTRLNVRTRLLLNHWATLHWLIHMNRTNRSRYSSHRWYQQLSNFGTKCDRRCSRNNDSTQ